MKLVKLLEILLICPVLAESQNCPPFFNKAEGKCVCYNSNDVFYTAMFTCRTEPLSSSLHIGYWVGYERAENSSEMDLIYSNCPNGYCYLGKNDYFQLPNDTTELEQAVCSSDRRGRLCGDCNKNMTVYFYSRIFKCGTREQCYLGPLFYLLSEILPLTVLYLLLTFFNISFTSGDLNGFIFFAQMIDSIIDVGKHYTHHKFYYVPLYRLFNLDFGGDYLSYCLWENADTMSILMFKYVTIVYILILVIITVLVIKAISMCKCVRLRKIRHSVIQGFSTFLVLSYSQCTELSFSILNPSFIYKQRKITSTVPFLQGSMNYFSDKHLQYAMPALLIVLCFIIPLPALLILQPLSSKLIQVFQLEEYKLVKFVSRIILNTKLKPLLDCFQSPFKDKFRFFSGMYFLYRATILASRFAPTTIFIYAVMELQLILMLTIHTAIQPYEKKLHNLIDALLIANLAIITVVKLVIEALALTKTSKTVILVIQIINIVLILIPFTLLTLCTCYKIVKKLQGLYKRNVSRAQEAEYVNAMFLEDDVREVSNENFILMDKK